MSVLDMLKGTVNRNITSHKVLFIKVYVYVPSWIDANAEYNPTVRPVLNFTQSLDVDMSLTLLQIIELNERQQIISTSVMHHFVR